jgi:hypothetical protein
VINFNPLPGKKKLVGIDLENLKKRVETNPFIERIKESIV